MSLNTCMCAQVSVPHSASTHDLVSVSVSICVHEFEHALVCLYVLVCLTCALRHRPARSSAPPSLLRPWYQTHMPLVAGGFAVGECGTWGWVCPFFF